MGLECIILREDTQPYNLKRKTGRMFYLMCILASKASGYTNVHLGIGQHLGRRARKTLSDEDVMQEKDDKVRQEDG